MHPLDICTGYWPDADNVLICSIQFYFLFHLIYLCLIVLSVLQLRNQSQNAMFPKGHNEARHTWQTTAGEGLIK